MLLYLLPDLLLVFLYIYDESYKEKETMEVANEILTSVEREKFNNLEELIAKIKDSFTALSFDIFGKHSSEFLKLANEVLSKQIITGEKI